MATQNGFTKSEYAGVASNKFKTERTDKDRFHVDYKHSEAATRNKTYAKKIRKGAIREF